MKQEEFFNELDWIYEQFNNSDGGEVAQGKFSDRLFWLVLCYKGDNFYKDWWKY